MKLSYKIRLNLLPSKECGGVSRPTREGWSVREPTRNPEELKLQVSSSKLIDQEADHAKETRLKYPRVDYPVPLTLLIA